ncbi:MAG: DUF4157 domain-containing protein [Chthoniobacterales bacterium]|nr:DUF4157 domain-containing protein [Chthoniobacterales bacterium]
MIFQGQRSPALSCQCVPANARLQRRAANDAAPAIAPPIVHQVLRSPGQPLEESTRVAMEARFGHDFGRVRIHSDSSAADSAQAVDAHAYTVGSHIAFAKDRFAPGTAEGLRLLKHELTHFLQQSEGEIPVPARLEVRDADDESERKAETMLQETVGADLAKQQLVGRATGPVLSRSPDDKPAGKGPSAGATAKATEPWSADNITIWMHTENRECNPDYVMGAFVEGTGPVQGDGPAGHRTCVGRLVAYEGEAEEFFLRYFLDWSGPGAAPYPHSKQPLKGISGVSARFEFTTAHGQQKVLFNGQDSAPTYSDGLDVKFGGGASTTRYAVIVPIIFPDSGVLRVLLQMHYVGPPAVDIVFDDLIDVELVRAGPGTETGIYLHVPDPKTPLVYKRITGREGWQKKGVIVTVWSDDRGYYYNSKAGKIRLPERP